MSGAFQGHAVPVDHVIKRAPLIFLLFQTLKLPRAQLLLSSTSSKIIQEKKIQQQLYLADIYDLTSYTNYIQEKVIITILLKERK